MPLSARQMEYLALAWQCFETEPRIDYDKFKTVAGLTSAHSARELMRVTKNKLRSEYGALSGEVQAANSATPKKASTPKINGGSVKKTPASRKRSSPKKSLAEEKKASSSSEAGGDDELELETPSKKIKVEHSLNGDGSGGLSDDDIFQ